MYEERYKSLSSFIRKHKYVHGIFDVLYHVLPHMVVIMYFITIAYKLYNRDYVSLIRIIAVPMMTFILCTVFRKVINEKRPYEIYNINPLIKKDKAGCSFPSRHTMSAAVIAMAELYVNIRVGIVAIVIAILIVILRPVAGVHFVKDVIAGMAAGILFGIIGFYIIP